jgi:hypothetical protein
MDGTGHNMYSGPFILWNVDSGELDSDDECTPLVNTGDATKEKEKKK